MTADPLILTLALDEASFAHFDSLRRRWFPPERDRVPAHLTLFHNLPGDELAAVSREVEQTSRRQAPLTLAVTGLRSLGRGVAYTLESADLLSLRASLASAFAGWLTAQDRQRYRPHVTVQNKVEARRARELLDDLAAGFAPFAVNGVGLQLWHYRGGPWEAVRAFAFEGDDGPTVRRDPGACAEHEGIAGKSPGHDGKGFHGAASFTPPSSAGLSRGPTSFHRVRPDVVGRAEPGHDGEREKRPT